MQVSFSRTGGFVPMPIGCRLDTASLPPGDAQNLTALIEQSGIMHMKDARVPGARDVHSYKIEIKDAGTQHIVTFDHISIPASVKPLIEFLSKHSKTLLGDD